MRSRNRLYAIPLLFSLAVLVACGGDDDNGTGPDTSGDELTQQETVEMLDALAAVGSFSFGLSGASYSIVDGPQAALIAASAVPVSETFDETESCPQGGSVRFDGEVNGDVDQETGAADLTFSMVQSHMDCVASSESGTTFTFSGAPSITTTMDLTSTSDGSFQIDGSQDGTLGWETSGKSGSCGFDLTFEFSGSANSFSGSISGTACGNSINETFDETI